MNKMVVWEFAMFSRLERESRTGRITFLQSERIRRADWKQKNGTEQGLYHAGRPGAS